MARENSAGGMKSENFRLRKLSPRRSTTRTSVTPLAFNAASRLLPTKPAPPVSMIIDRGSDHYLRAGYSSRGPQIELSAPRFPGREQSRAYARRQTGSRATHLGPARSRVHR